MEPPPGDTREESGQSGRDRRREGRCEKGKGDSGRGEITTKLSELGLSWMEVGGIS